MCCCLGVEYRVTAVRFGEALHDVVCFPLLQASWCVVSVSVSLSCVGSIESKARVQRVIEMEIRGFSAH